MSDLPDFLQSETNYWNIFNDGLERLLDQEKLNLFILVCANATFDGDLFAKLQTRLSCCFENFQHK